MAAREVALARCVSALLGAGGAGAGGGGGTPESCLTFESLRDGVALDRLLQDTVPVGEAAKPMSPSSGSSSSEVSDTPRSSSALRAKLGMLASVRDSVLTFLGPSAVYSDRTLLRAGGSTGAAELSRLVSMVLACLVQGTHKERYIRRIMEMDIKYQGEIMEAIKVALPRSSDPKSPASALIGRLTPRHSSIVHGCDSSPRGRMLFVSTPNSSSDNNADPLPERTQETRPSQ